MAKDQKPDFSCQTNDKPNSVVDAPCKKACKVTYRFVFRSKLSMPYAVAVNGVPLPVFKERAKRTEERIALTVETGQMVQLFLNSDAHPAFRKQPVYAVKAGDDDVEVVITEVAGKHSDTDTPTSTKTSKDDSSGRSLLHMVAKLTGDIWMKISHKYAEDEVDSRLPAGTSDEVKSAIKRIYGGLSSATLVLERSALGAEPARKLTVNFADSNNPKENITNYALLRDGLPRVHPGGYAALLNAALEAGIESLTVSSCWRPMLGSIAHRAGLGLDVSVLGATTLNRQELRRALNAAKTNPHGNGNDKDSVTDAEVTAFDAYERASVDTNREAAEKITADKALASALKSNNPEAIRLAQERQSKTTQALATANQIELDKDAAWNRERDKGEPIHVRRYRTYLLKCSCVRQLFDPWFMDADTHDAIDPEPNMQKTANEILHAHHLHITVDEPMIL